MLIALAMICCVEINIETCDQGKTDLNPAGAGKVDQSQISAAIAATMDKNFSKVERDFKKMDSRIRTIEAFQESKKKEKSGGKKDKKKGGRNDGKKESRNRKP
jgi:hypothetical protein